MGLAFTFFFFLNKPLTSPVLSLQHPQPHAPSALSPSTLPTQNMGFTLLCISAMNASSRPLLLRPAPIPWELVDLVELELSCTAVWDLFELS